MRLQSRRKSKFPKRTQFTTYRRISLASAKASVQQPASNAKEDAHDVRDPVVYVCTAIEAGLDEFNGATIGARTDEDWHQPKAARACQWEGECREGYEVHQLVASLRRRGLSLQWPEHRDGQGERHNEGEGDVEVLAHPPGCIWGEAQRQASACVALVPGKVERRSESGVWGFR